GGLTSQRREFERIERVTRKQRRLQALLTRLLHDQSGLGMVTAEIDHIDFRILELADEGRVILLAGSDALIEHFLHARLVQGFAGEVRKTFAVSGRVVDDRDVLALEMFCNPGAREGALLIVAAAGAE